MPIENATANRGYQLPDAANDLNVDVLRLIAALNGIDTDVAAVFASLAGKADTGHGHAIADVGGLQTALDGKAASAHAHGLNDLTDVDVSTSATGQVLMKSATGWVPGTVDLTHNHDGVYAPVSHNHDGVYAPVSHNHDGVYALVNHNHNVPWQVFEWAASSFNGSAPHGLGGSPQEIQAVLHCVVAELGYSPGDEVVLGTGDSYYAGTTVYVNTTTVGFSMANNTMYLAARTGGGLTSITPANWKIIIRLK